MARVFVGREAARAALEELIARGAPLITIAGIGGVGKSRLAREAIDGAARADLAGAGDRAAALDALRGALDLPIRGGELDDIEAEIAGALGAVELAVIDNLEPGAAAVIGRLVDAAPATTLVVTARRPLRHRSEEVIALGPLAAGEAAELFVAVRRAHGQRDEPGPAERAQIARLVDRLDRIPLAIELAARRARVASLDELERLIAGDAAWDARLREVIAASIDGLSGDAAALLAAISALPAGAGGDLARTLGAAGAIEELVDASLVQRLEVGAPAVSRFVPFRAVAALARERVAPAGHRAAAALVELAGGWAGVAKGADAAWSLSRLAAERANLLAIARDPGSPPPLVAGAAVALYRYFAHAGGYPLARDVFDRGVDAAREIGEPDRIADTLARRGWLRLKSGDHGGAGEDFAGAASGPGAPAAMARVGIAAAAIDARRFEDADAALAAAHERYRELGDEVEAESVETFAAIVKLELGELDAAGALAGRLAARDTSNRPVQLLIGAGCHHRRGHLAEAGALYDRALESAARVNPGYAGHVRLHRAALSAERGDLEGAASELDAAAAKLAELGEADAAGAARSFAALVAAAATAAAPARAAIRGGHLGAIYQRLESALAGREIVRIAADGSWFETAASGRVSLSRRKIAARLVARLLEARRRDADPAVTASELIEAGWPGERMLADAATNRLHVAIATLRRLGLGALETVEAGYRLDPNAWVVVAEAS